MPVTIRGIQKPQGLRAPLAISLPTVNKFKPEIQQQVQAVQPPMAPGTDNRNSALNTFYMGADRYYASSTISGLHPSDAFDGKGPMGEVIYTIANQIDPHAGEYWETTEIANAHIGFTYFLPQTVSGFKIHIDLQDAEAVAKAPKNISITWSKTTTQLTLSPNMEFFIPEGAAEMQVAFSETLTDVRKIQVNIIDNHGSATGIRIKEIEFFDKDKEYLPGPIWASNDVTISSSDTVGSTEFQMEYFLPFVDGSMTATTNSQTPGSYKIVDGTSVWENDFITIEEGAESQIAPVGFYIENTDPIVTSPFSVGTTFSDTPVDYKIVDGTSIWENNPITMTSASNQTVLSEFELEDTDPLVTGTPEVTKYDNTPVDYKIVDGTSIWENNPITMTSASNQPVLTVYEIDDTDPLVTGNTAYTTHSDTPLNYKIVDGTSVWENNTISLTAGTTTTVATDYQEEII